MLLKWQMERQGELISILGHLLRRSLRRARVGVTCTQAHIDKPEVQLISLYYR